MKKLNFMIILLAIVIILVALVTILFVNKKQNDLKNKGFEIYLENNKLLVSDLGNIIY